jgi:hypothetical protein
MVTGIPPNQDADEFLAAKNHPLKKFARKMKRRLNGGSKKSPRTKVYRHRNELSYGAPLHEGWRPHHLFALL